MILEIKIRCQFLQRQQSPSQWLLIQIQTRHYFHLDMDCVLESTKQDKNKIKYYFISHFTLENSSVLSNIFTLACVHVIILF